MRRLRYTSGNRWWPIVAVACVASPAAHPPLRSQSRAGDPIDPAWLTFDSTSRTAQFKLTAGLTPLNGALNFNGFRDGELTLVVPAGWTVAVDFYNHDGMLAHSAQVVPAMTPLPLRAMDHAAVARAYTDKVEEGLPPETRDKMRFSAQPPGEYFVICGVPGHAASGMWIRLSVSADTKLPALVAGPKRAP